MFAPKHRLLDLISTLIDYRSHVSAWYKHRRRSLTLGLVGAISFSAYASIFIVFELDKIYAVPLSIIAICSFYLGRYWPRSPPSS